MELKGGHISKVDAAGKFERVIKSPGPNGMKLHPDGSLWACECKRKAVIRVDLTTKETTMMADGCGGVPLLGPNDLCFGITERCYFTDPDGSSLKNRIGALYRRERNGAVHREVDGLAYPNGLALTPDDAQLVFAETMTGMLWICDRAPDGSLGGRRPFCEVGGKGGPDGMAYDAEGHLYVAIFGDGCVRVVDPRGQISGEIALPGKNPTNCCFGGKDWRILFVTEAERGELLEVALDKPGLPIPPRPPTAEPF